MPSQVVPENVDEETQNYVHVIWLARKDTRLNLEKHCFAIRYERESVIISEYFLFGKASILR